MNIFKIKFLVLKKNNFIKVEIKLKLNTWIKMEDSTSKANSLINSFTTASILKWFIVTFDKW